MKNVADRLEALLPELEYARETHVQWRDCDQSWRDQNPDIGDAEFHTAMVSVYDERIETIRDAVNQLRAHLVEMKACADFAQILEE